MKKVLLPISLVLLCYVACIAQPTLQAVKNVRSVGVSPERLALLDQHIEKFVNEGHVPGGVFYISRKGKTIYHKNFGYRSLDKKQVYQKDDIFRLASMTKAFTTVSILQLFERGKLGLDDPIFYYIPAFSKSGVLDEYNESDTTFTTVPANQPITIRHLLTHTSGITYGSFNPGKIQAIYTKTGVNRFGLSHETMSMEEMANQMGKIPLMFQPGERYMYGLNMEILGRIIEVVSGQALNQYFQDHIFTPLGMKDTGFYFPTEKHDRIVPVYSYNDKGESIMAGDTPFGKMLEYPKVQNRNYFAGGGGSSGTAVDYATFLEALLYQGKSNRPRILSRKTIEVMTSDQMILLNKKGNGFSQTPGITFGLGFMLTTKDGTAVSHKSAGTYEWSGYFNTKYFVDPQEELVFVGLTQIVPFQRGDFWDKLNAIIYGAIED